MRYSRSVERTLNRADCYVEIEVMEASVTATEVPNDVLTMGLIAAHSMNLIIIASLIYQRVVIARGTN
jgi:hypothetical protein